MQVCDKAIKLAAMIRGINGLANGVPSLVRVVLQEAVRRAHREKWATRPLQYIVDALHDPQMPYSQAITAAA